MLTTLYCDASFCPRDLVGGWAVWLRSERGRHVEAGVLPAYCKEANTAELAAIYAGIYRAVTIWPSTSAVLVRSDSTTALGWMDRQYVPRLDTDQKLLRKILDLKNTHGVRLIPRWVKGHRDGAEVDAYLNRQVDERARNVMLRQREKARGGARDSRASSRESC